MYAVESVREYLTRVQNNITLLVRVDQVRNGDGTLYDPAFITLSTSASVIRFSTLSNMTICSFSVFELFRFVPV
jgi:hypothetical protein